MEITRYNCILYHNNDLNKTNFLRSIDKSWGKDEYFIYPG